MELIALIPMRANRSFDRNVSHAKTPRIARMFEQLLIRRFFVRVSRDVIASIGEHESNNNMTKNNTCSTSTILAASELLK